MNIKTINSHCVLVLTDDKNGCTWSATVFSYDTPVLHCDGATNKLYRLWGGYSATTLRDINRAMPWQHMDKKTWDKMPVESMITFHF